MPATEKFSQIVAASPAAITDTLIGVQGGTTDVQYRIEDLIPYIPATGNVNYYVATTGSDSNPGTIGSPFATIQHALNQAALFNYTEGGFTLTINVEDGTYASPAGLSGIQIPLFYGINTIGQAQINGNIATPANCVINFTSTSAGFVSNFRSQANIAGFTLNNSGDNFIIRDGVFFIDAIIMNLQNANATGFQVRDTGQINIGFRGITISSVTGSATFLIFGNELGVYVDNNGQSWTMSNACTFADVFQAAGNSSLDMLDGAGTWTGKNNISGEQYAINGAGFFFYGEGVPDFSRKSLPGTSVGRNFNAPFSVVQNDHNYDIVTPLTGTTVTMFAVSHQLIINPAGALAALTVVLPTYATENDIVRITTTQTITALTISAAATFGVTPSIVGAPTTLAAGGSFQMRYVVASTTWFIS